MRTDEASAARDQNQLPHVILLGRKWFAKNSFFGQRANRSLTRCNLATKGELTIRRVPQMKTGNFTRTKCNRVKIMDCGGKRSATSLSHAWATPKAPSRYACRRSPK